MKITNYSPKNWKDLQDQVCRYMKESGYNAETPKTIELVRGSVEVDVFASSEDELTKQIICECKYWDSPVSKEKVHAFRTVVQDSGSTVGIIIAKSGFQKGAYEAAYSSNIILKDWNSFLSLIEKNWKKNMSKVIQDIVYPISLYIDFFDMPIEKLSKESRIKYDKITNQVFKAYSICKDIENIMLNQETVELDGILFSVCDELCEYCINKCTVSINEYKKLFSDLPEVAEKLIYYDLLNKNHNRKDK